ncbi:MAG: protein kinase, partial [Myxococcales bacterium]|nr:protein kinase [Myxococcales bacterium]
MTSSPELGAPSDALAGSGAESPCSEIDALLAARGEGTLDEAGAAKLDRHLATCAECREVAETLSPTADRGGDHAQLPSVDPHAYELGLEIARGGMGRVLAARDLRVGRPVAVKELLGRSSQLAARFEREARVTARLQHPGILPIYEIGRWPDGTPFYTMRMVEGERLFDAIASAPTLAARLALLPAVLAASEAVAFAHGQRVIHRDLTPANILVGAYGETVVIDWGLAKGLGAGDDDPDDEVRADGSGDQLTAAGAVIGTPAYMPPEQAHAQPVDERADVYALGAILYHLLAGVAPYRGSSSRELLRAVRTGPPPLLGDVVTGVPRDLISIVDKAMARDPADRYPTARELAEELKRFQTGRLVEAHAYSGADRIARILKKHKGVVSVAAFAAVLLGAMAIISVTRVLASRAEARRQVRELLVEEARVELLAGFPLRALAFLDEAAAQGTDSPSLAFLREAAIAAVPESERVLDCGDDVRWIEISRDGARIAAACRNRARVWDASGALLFTLQAPRGFNKIAFSPDGSELLSWGDGHEARVWDAATGALRAVLDHGAGINDAGLTRDNARAVTFGQDGTAQVWRVATQTRERTIVAKQYGLLYVFGRISRDDTQVLTMTMEGQGRGWSIDTGEPVGGFDHGGHTLLLGGDYSLDGARSSTCGTDRLAKVWDMRSGGQTAVLGGNTDVVWK